MTWSSFSSESAHTSLAISPVSLWQSGAAASANPELQAQAYTNKAASPADTAWKERALFNFALIRNIHSRSCDSARAVSSQLRKESAPIRLETKRVRLETKRVISDDDADGPDEVGNRLVVRIAPL